ncbi:MAG: dihydrolipoamide acetyltransferase family protein [Actinomycetota bacterium]|nr:dihydrolipoamide acetyltransferase family protein [Actinomycetota bacterium]
MAYELNVPDIGEGLTEAEIVRWLIAPGAPVAANEPLVEVETDKAVVEIPSPQAGVLLHQGGAEGAVVKVGSLLAVIGAEGEDWAVSEAEVLPQLAAPTEVSTAIRSDTAIKAMPIVRKLARELGVDLAAIEGTGPGGKITRDDVQRVAGEEAPAAPLVSSAAAGPASTRPGEYGGETLSALRRTISRNLTQSWTEIPHVTVWRPADATRILQARAETGAPLEALLVKAVLPVLAEYPDCNATFDGTTLRRSESAHVGVAVDTAAGLMVPVVRNAETMNLRGLGTEIERLSEGARARTLGLGELTGGTFTVSNVGAVGGGYGTPIIPYGTTAIVSIGRAEEDVVVRNNAIAIAPVFPVSLSFDHRVIDGAVASRFLRLYVDQIESYGLAR